MIYQINVELEDKSLHSMGTARSINEALSLGKFTAIVSKHKTFVTGDDICDIEFDLFEEYVKMTANGKVILIRRSEELRWVPDKKKRGVKK
jgi:hypothetical protein